MLDLGVEREAEKLCGAHRQAFEPLLQAWQASLRARVVAKLLHLSCGSVLDFASSALLKEK